MVITSQKLSISFLALGLFAFVSLSILGLGHMNMNGMIKNENGDMTGCIFTGKTMLCKMSVVEHISLWQSMFTAMSQESLVLFALLILLVVAIFITKKILAPPRLSSDKSSKQKLYLIQHPNLSLSDPFKEAFSQGILNPKIYDFATL